MVDSKGYQGTDFKYEVVHSIGEVCRKRNGEKIEANLISYNGSRPKLDIRNWSVDSGRMLKGVTMTLEQGRELQRLLDTFYREVDDGSLIGLI